jgi:hypothetical protein
MKKKIATFALLFASLSGFNAQANQAKEVLIDNPYVREMPPTAPATGAFMTFENTADAPAIIVKAASDAAKTVELHTHIHDNGVMRMREIAEIVIPANGQTELKPGGLHIMLIGPTRALKEGDMVEIELFFKDGSQTLVNAPVKKIMGMGMNRGQGQGQHMHNH